MTVIRGGVSFAVAFHGVRAYIVCMKDGKLYIVMVGLPARGKSTIASRLKENLSGDSIRTRIFNNGNLRRRLTSENTSYPEFYAPTNTEGVALRERFALMNMRRARNYLNGGGQVAILDATHASLKRREKINRELDDHTVLFVECINDDGEILRASILRKIETPEFQHLGRDAAILSFNKRIQYYSAIYRPVEHERNFVRLNSLHNQIREEEIRDSVPFYDRVRDILVTDTVRNLFLVRHGETHFNLENRIGGDSGLTDNGREQARALAAHFRRTPIPVIFTSAKKRTIETASPIQDAQADCAIISLDEFDEIDSGICECMSYEEIRDSCPGIYKKRSRDKYNYVYPGGEGYVSMKQRIYTGIKKALYLSGNARNIMVVGHRAVNRMILAHFLFRRQEDVPYTYIPQDKFYHVVATQDKKLFQLKKFRVP